MTVDRAYLQDIHDETKEEAAMSTQDDAEPSYRVLLVDDSRTMQKLTSGLLDRAGHQVTIANTGEDALAALKSDDAFDIVLMDVEMPGMDGLEATRRIRHVESLSGRHTPIIGLTTIERSRCLSAGMDGHLQKPTTPKQLRETIRRFLHAA